MIKRPVLWMIIAALVGFAYGIGMHYVNAQTMTGTITGLPGTTGTYTFNGTLTPPCSEITAPNGSLTDNSGAVWSWGSAATGGNYSILRNGSASGGSAVVLALAAGTIYAKSNYSGTINWWSYAGSNNWNQLNVAPSGCN